MSDEVSRFLARFVDANINVSAYVEPEEEDSDRLADACRAEAESEDISPDDLEAAADGDLSRYIHSEMMSAYKNEMARVRDKD